MSHVQVSVEAAPVRRGGARAPAVAAERSGEGWRAWLPSAWVLVLLAVAGGLALCAWAEDLSRETLAPDPWIYWMGIILIVGSITLRVTAVRASSRERILLVALAGFCIYLARMMEDPYGFTFVDDFSHGLSLEHVIATHHLFHADVLLPIVAHYPGLEGSASAIAFLTHMSVFGSGILMVGACRVAVMLGLYVLYTGVSRSARVGALAALLFAANSNFMYFETQFAYETLSLPLLALILAAMAERQRSVSRGDIRAWGICAIVGICALVPTHHLTSYTLCLILWLMSVRRVRLPARLGGARDLNTGPAVWPYALFATVLSLTWLVVVASQTVGYISPDIVNAFKQAFRTVVGGTHARALFSGSAGAGTSNLLSEEAASFIEPVLLLIVGAIGLWRTWRRPKLDALEVIFSVMAVLFFFLTALRVVPSAWEVGNRGAEFMFLGMGFMVGTATLWKAGLWARPLFRMFVGLLVGLCVVGAAVAGAAADTRLSHPTQFTAANGHRIVSQTLAVADWFRHAPPGAVLADDAEAEAINLYGGHTTYGGTEDDADNILSLAGAYPGEVATVRREHIRYVVVDLRQRSQNGLTGLFVDMVPPAAPVDSLFPRAVLAPWRPAGAAVFDSGDIIVFDLDQRP